MNGLIRVWKHPFLLDTFLHLADARAAHPHLSRFERVVWCGDLILVRSFLCRVLVPTPLPRARARDTAASCIH